MNNGNQNRPRRPQGRPGSTPVRRPAPPRPDMSDALNERYEEMVLPNADGVKGGKYADLSTFESRGHRKISPAVMRARRRRELVRRYLPVAVIALVALIALWVYLGAIRPASLYAEAVGYFTKGDYSSADKVFGKIYDYKDSSTYVAYIDARDAYESGDYANAKLIFESLGDFADSHVMAETAAARLNGADKEAMYDSAEKLYNQGKYAEALEAFRALGAYLDSADKAKLCENEINYAEAVRLLSIGEEERAKAIFLSLGSFRDSAARARAIGTDDPDTMTDEERYLQAKADLDAGKLSSANLAFYALGDYKDSKRYADYTYAVMCASGGDYGTAYVCFRACGDFLEARAKGDEAGYNYAVNLYMMQDESRLPEVIRVFEDVHGYADSADMLYAAKDQYKTAAIFAYNDGDKERALAIFESLAGHPECDRWAERIRNELA